MDSGREGDRIQRTVSGDGFRQCFAALPAAEMPK
jgi:hypothetical protein